MTNEEFEIENHLKDLRKQHKLSQEELAIELGISRQSIIALEQGKSLPSLPLAISMCRFFDSAFEDMFNFGQEIEEEIDRILDDSGESRLNKTLESPFRVFDNEKANVAGSIKNANANININNVEKSNRLPIQKNIMDSPGLLDGKETVMSNELGPWRPFREMVSLRDAMDRLFEDSVITPKTGATMPKIDIKDKKDAIVVKAELPGMAEEEVEVEISDGVMTISGEKKEEKEKEEEGYYYKESHSGTFSRSFALPADIKEEKAEAEMKNGVLIITIPKIAPKKATVVKVSPKKK